MTKKHKTIIILSVIISGIFILLHNTLNDSIKEIIDAILLITSILIVTLLIAKELIKSNINKKKISKEDKAEVKNYTEKYKKIELSTKTKQVIKNEGHWYIFDEIEYLNNLCKDFLKGSKLYENKKDIIDSVKELDNYIRDNNIKELKPLSKDNNKILEIIFSYYDERGNWR